MNLQRYELYIHFLLRKIYSVQEVSRQKVSWLEVSMQEAVPTGTYNEILFSISTFSRALYPTDSRKTTHYDDENIEAYISEAIKI